MMRRWLQGGAALLVSLLGLNLMASVALANPAGSMRLGIPGLFQTVTGPHEGGAPLRLGLYLEHGIIDDGHGFDDPSFLPDLTTQQLRLQLGLQWGHRLSVAASLPWRRYEIAAGGRIPPAAGAGMSDLQLSAAADLIDLVGGAWATGLWGSLRLPTGDEEKGLSTGVTEGEIGLQTTLSLFEDSIKPATHLTLNLGYRYNRNEENGYGVLASEYSRIDSTGVFPPSYPALGAGESASANDQLLLRAALEVRQRWARIFLEYSANWLAFGSISSYRESPSWITPGISLGTEGSLSFQASWSIGLWSDDPNTPFKPNLPEWILSAGLSYPFFLGTRDRDHDGVKDRRDRCPDVAEDRDGFQDDDGCPDWDNDGDGIPDGRDLCPNQAEDRDGFEDQDGCPDPDNDHDGIPDVDDLCPLRAEDFNGIADEDGCPDGVIDSDGDGIPDSRDTCPHQAEDFDGFEDDDGCPDPDNDLDGIEDRFDKCPLQPENYNGIEDDDGCPELAPEPQGKPTGNATGKSGRKKTGSDQQ